MMKEEGGVSWKEKFYLQCAQLLKGKGCVG